MLAFVHTNKNPSKSSMTDFFLQINVDSKTREATESNLSRADTKTFEAAQKRIEALMEKDSYPRFLQSDLFQRLLQQRQAADHSLKVT